MWHSIRPMKAFALVLLIIATTCIPNGNAAKEKRDEQQKAIYKNNELVQMDRCDRSTRDILLVSLMNGEISALDLNDGSKLWSRTTGGKLLSSSITNLEVIYNGIPTRLVPSLDGSLFRFHDDSFEPLPFTAETLLSSSFKLAGDSTVVGSKELRTFGLDPSCGQVHYKCDKEGCESSNQRDVHELDVLVIKHMTHTVRAASIRHGIEKWNFSVGHHELNLVEATVPQSDEQRAEDCDSTKTICADPANGLPRLKFSVSDGFVMRIKDEHSSEAMWKHEFCAPVSKSWVLRNNKLIAVDLLDPKFLMINEGIAEDQSNAGVGGETHQVPPSLYIGMFDNQVYIQPSVKLQQDVSVIANLYKRGAKIFTALPKVRWAPYISSTPSRTPWLNYGKADPTGAPPRAVSKHEENSLSLFHPTMDYPYDQGFYLTMETTGLDNDTPHVVAEEVEHGEDGVLEELEQIMIVQIVSLTYYWKEVLFISLCSAVILNIILYITRAHRRRLKNKLKCFGSETNLSDISDVSEDDKVTQRKKQVKTVEDQPETIQELVTLPPPPPPPQYHSRYQSDFTHIQCLGKGGFGVVFHAQNALDECDYAIKRITLPNSVDAKEKVTREVKALAKLDHPNIVRYFQSWFETPPPGWQEDRDKVWESTEKFMPTPMNSIQPFSRQQSLVTRPTAPPEKGMFVPKFRFDDSKDASASFGFPANNRLDDSLDIVFGSQTNDGVESGSAVHQPFHKYAVAPSDDSDSDQSESDIEWDQLDDSGYHKNPMAPVESTGSFGSEDWTNDQELSKQSTPTRRKRSLSPKKRSNSSQNKVSTCSKGDNSKGPQAKLFLYIQMQLCKRETLRDYLNANTLFRDRNSILLIFRQICDAVEYIHSQGLIHRDLKPTNIFFSLEDTIKVGDFGLVTALAAMPDDEGAEGLINGQTPAQQQINLTGNVGTQIYMSPEQMAGKMYNSKVDIYALGLVFFELKYPFSTMMERVLTLQGIKKHKFPERFHRELPEEYKFVKWMLARNPSKRPSITQVLNSDIMSGAAELLAEKIRTRTISRSSSND